MGITNSKPKKPKLAKPAKPAKPLKHQKPAKSFFESQKRKEQEKEQEKIRQDAQPAKVRRPHANKLKSSPLPVSADSLGRGAVTTTTRPASQELAQSYDQEAIDRMRKQLRGDASAFLLNNIMLSVQFFPNYEKVVWDLKNNSVTDADVLLNDKMAQHHKHVFLPDKLQEAVHVHARLGTGPGARGPPEALQPQRMFVVHDNVEVNEPGEVSDYSTVLDAPYYRMLMEEDDEPGYVKLKKLEILENRLSRDEPSIKIDTTEPLNKSRYSSDSETESEESGIKSKDEEITEGTNFMNELKEQIDVQAIKKPNNLRINLDHMIINNGGPKSPRKTDTGEIIQERRPSGIMKTTNKAVLHGQLQASESKQKKERQRAAANKVSPSGSESSGYRTSYSPLTESSGNESDYGYATITAATTPRKLQKSRTANFNDSTSIIPAKCITAVSVKTFHDDSEDEDEIDEAYSARYGTQFQRMYYLNSFTFMGNFSDIFLMKLAHSLGLAESLNDALTQGASIYCNVKKGLPKSISFEIIPALNTTWPNIAQEWVTRRRKMIRNPRTNFTYQWPTQVMVGKARGLGCLIVPLGFRPTRGTNPEQNLQWKLTFPAVERFLETCLAHSHVRCYLFTLVLFRTFIKNDASKAGLDYTHVRNHLFTQCEDNYAMWPEDRLGETLRIFLKSFYQLIMRGRMSDYFIPKCNILKGIPTSILLKQQRMLADILESPVMHLLSSLRNIKYMTSNFYPVLDYQKLYKILTTTDVLKMMNPNLPSKEADSDDSDNEIAPTTGFWQDLKNPPKDPRDQKVRDTGYQRRKNYLRNIEAKKAGESLVNNRKTTREPIDRKAVVPPHLEANKRRLILELFIPHFLAMAESSERLEASRQAIIYLEHANRLSILLKGEAGGEGAGREFIAIIREKIEILKDKVGNPGAPQVPRRNESFNSNSSRAGTSGIKKLKSDQYMNLENVNTSDHSNFKAGEPVSPTVKLASIVLADVHVEKEKPKFIRAFSFQKVEEEDEDGDEDDEEEDDSDDEATETNL